MRPAEQWGTTQAPSSATPNGGQLSIERDEKTGDIEMNITAPRQNTDPNAWQQAPMYLAPQVYPNSGASGGGSGYPGYQPGYPGYQPGYPGYQPGYPPNRPGFRPPYYPGYPDRYPSGQTGWPGAPSRPWPPTSGLYPGQRPSYPAYPGYPGQKPSYPTRPSYPSYPGQKPSYPTTPSYPSYPGQNTGQYPNPNPGGLYPPPTDGWHWYPGYQGDPGPYPPGVMPLNQGMRNGVMRPRSGGVPQGRMPYGRR